MSILEVTCIRRSAPGLLNPHAHIEGIGGGSAGLLGVPWFKSEAEAIRDIETGANQFFTNVGGHAAPVIVATMPDGRTYLTTTPDQSRQNNLLSLPLCP